MLRAPCFRVRDHVWYLFQLENVDLEDRESGTLTLRWMLGKYVLGLEVDGS
jgi:hypothetical protein